VHKILILFSLIKIDESVDMIDVKKETRLIFLCEILIAL